MRQGATVPSARASQLLDQAYAYVLEHGLSDVSLRPLAAAIGSSPRVLLFLFHSKDELVASILRRARADEEQLLCELAGATDLVAGASRVWHWLADPDHSMLLKLWVETYARSLIDPTGPWGGFAARTVEDWLELLGRLQPAAVRRTARGRAERTAVLATLRGGMLDLLATGDRKRTTAAVAAQLAAIQRDRTVVGGAAAGSARGRD
jgi:AcrR family transcriptional regulator